MSVIILLYGCWNSAKNMLFWRQVIGYIQRFLPACYAQAFSQGLYYIVENGEKLRRSLEFRYDPGVFIFPLDADPHFRLGYEYGCATLGADLRARACGGSWPARAGLFRSLCQTKTAGLQNLCSTQALNQRICVS